MLLEARGVEAGYGENLVLRGIDMAVDKGEIVVVMGHNGSGKTTALRTLTGLLKPRSGSILLDGRDITGSPPAQVIRNGISVVPQGRNIFSNLKVQDNIEVASYVIAGAAGRRRQLDMVYGLFPMLRERRSQLAGTLSGGQQQLVSLAMALVTGPRLIVLDEPSVGLSPLLVAEVMRRIAEVNAGTGTSVLMVEQNISHALAIAHRAYVLKLGLVTYAGDAQALRGREDLWQMF